MRKLFKSINRYLLTNLAYNFYNHGYFGKANDCFEKMWKSDVMDSDTSLVHGMTLYQLKKYEQGVDVLDRAIEANPDDLRLMYMKSICLQGMKAFEKALELSEKVVAVNNSNDDFMINHANILGRLGKAKEAIIIYNQLIHEAYWKSNNSDSSPNVIDDNFNQSTNTILLNNLGFELCKIKEYEKAILYFNRAIEVDKEMAFAYNNRGLAFTKLGQLDRAREDIEHSLRLHPNNSYAYKNKALYLLKKEKTKEALIALEKAKQLGYADDYDDEVDQLIFAITKT